MTRVIGWYAHHVGAGHVARARLVADQMRTPVVILSSAPRPDDWPPDQWVSLPIDDAVGGRDHRAGGALHWAPLGHQGYRDRMSVVAAWLGQARPTLLMSDVSVEVVMLARTLGVPVATMVMAGDRRDRPHRLGYDAASLLFAAWPSDVQPVLGWRPEWDAKTVHLGGFSRFDTWSASGPPRRRNVTVIWGRGGATVGPDDIRAAARATPGWTWSVCDETRPEWVFARLQASDVIVCHAGQNVVAEVAAARRPAVVIPEPRPHDEQRHLALALTSLGLASGLTSWPEPTDWGDLLEQAVPSSPELWSHWNDRRGATRFADILDDPLVVGAA